MRPREPVVHQEPLLLICQGGPSEGEWRPTLRSWWPVGHENGGKPAGIYIRKCVRGGAHFEWYDLTLPSDVIRIETDFLYGTRPLENGGSGLFWIDAELRNFMTAGEPWDRGNLRSRF